MAPATEDERLALLRLLRSGHSYEDIAGLLGISTEEVRSRASEAEGGPAAASDAAPGEPRRPRSRRTLIAVIAAVGSLVTVGALLVAFGAFEGSSEAPPPPPDAAEEVSVIPLSPVGGSSARGEARIARIGDQPVLDIDASRLEPTGAGSAYIVWLYNSPRQAFPIGFRPVAADGRLSGQTPIPTGAIPLLPRFRFLDLSLADSSEAIAVVRRAAERRRIPPHVGESVLRGELRR